LLIIKKFVHIIGLQCNDNVIKFTSSYQAHVSMSDCTVILVTTIRQKVTAFVQTFRKICIRIFIISPTTLCWNYALNLNYSEEIRVVPSSRNKSFKRRKNYRIRI